MLAYDTELLNPKIEIGSMQEALVNSVGLDDRLRLHAVSRRITVDSTPGGSVKLEGGGHGGFFGGWVARHATRNSYGSWWQARARWPNNLQVPHCNKQQGGLQRLVSDWHFKHTDVVAEYLYLREPITR